MGVRHALNTTPQLGNPPISEVVCGFWFDPLPLTTLDMGVYWERRKPAFPRYELRPPLFEGIEALPRVHDARVWLVGPNDHRVVQLQRDRLYVNWRRNQGQYPRFQNHGAEQGIRDWAMAEFEQFKAFAAERTSEPLHLTHLELSKINTLSRGTAYTDFSDLRQLLPVTAVLEQVGMDHPQQFQLRLAQEDGLAQTVVAVVMTNQRVTIEIHHVFPFSGDLSADFVQANHRANQVFFGLVHTERFQQELS